MKNNTLNFIKNYINLLYVTLLNVEKKYILSSIDLIEKKIKKNKNIYVCGNGGASSISNHLLCDFNKGIKYSSNKKTLKPKVMSFSSNNDLLTAISNDFSFDRIFSDQIENFAKRGDLLILFSCSGMSKNIIKAAECGRKNNLDIISIVGFKNSIKLKNFSNIFINLQVDNYGIAEDIFQSIVHIISQAIRVKYS